MNHIDKSQEIKKALLQGGLVLSGRNTGKTKALAEILLEDRDAVVLVRTQGQFERLRQFLLDGGMSKNDIYGRILRSERELLGLHKNVYIDEYFLFLEPYSGHFKAATASLPFPVKVI